MDYKEFESRVLTHFDSETVHNLVRTGLHFSETFPLTLSLLEKLNHGGERFTDPRLKVNLAGIDFPNPIMVGAGWDKEAGCVLALYTLGAGGVEIGTVVEFSQYGNPKPRQFRIAPGIAVNRCAFNSPGMEKVARNLDRYLNSGIPIGVNIGPNKNLAGAGIPESLSRIVKRLDQYASYFTLDVSSPNTPGLRDLQSKKGLEEIVQAIETEKPVFIKIAPELHFEEVDDVIDVCLQNNLAGIIATNTVDRVEIKIKHGIRWANEKGGLSGDDPEFRAMATEKVAYIYKETGGKLDISGVGGVKDAGIALEKIMAGAKLVQVVTAFRGEGLGVLGKINREIIEWMERYGVKNLSEIVGATNHLYKF